MILHEVELHNFGIYNEKTRFDLSPQSGEQFHRPLILIRGKNGVGKSTLMEAIRLCLHGKLALGNRIRQRDYEEYLRQRLHRNENGETAISAYISLEFGHVLLGHRHQYRVQRAWRTNSHRLITELHVWVDGELLTESNEDKEYLLRELVPVGVAELFFFDGEKIATLSEEGRGSADLLADTVKKLLGLQLVEQLDRDLDVYLTRQAGTQEVRTYQDNLARLHDEEAELVQQRKDVRAQLAEQSRQLSGKRAASVLLEERIAHEGGRYADDKNAHEAEQQKITAAIAQVEQEIYELSRGLMPFSVAPNLLRAVQIRLQREAAYARWQASQPLLREIETLIEETGTVYQATTSSRALYESERNILISRLQELLQAHSEPPMAEDEIVHHVSAEMRGVLLNWIDEALSEAPRRLATLLQQRQALQMQLEEVDEALSRVPLTAILQPLQDQLRQLDRELGRLEAEQERLLTEERRLTYHLERIAARKRRVSEQIADIDTDENRIKLAARIKILLDDYKKQLTERKLAQLSAQLCNRFNQLSRKRNFLERVHIDPDTFVVTLYRAGKPFPRVQLSAGEEQVFALATLWALREVSERPLPVIMDTPLGRLDDDHRRSILAEFMPQVAQQVIVLATTTEINEETFAFLQPITSRAYLLQADQTTTQAHEQTMIHQAPSVFQV